jgi:hypothetical protein
MLVGQAFCRFITDFSRKLITVMTSVKALTFADADHGHFYLTRRPIVCLLDYGNRCRHGDKGGQSTETPMR